MKQRVVITGAVPDLAIAILSRDFEVVAHPGNEARTEEDLIAMFDDADGAITLLGDPVTRRVLESCDDLRIVSNFAVGTDNIDLEAARERGIAVTNTPGVLTDATADLTIALMLMVTRRLVEGDALLRRGGFEGWSPLFHLGTSIQGRQLGIVGMGRIGSAVALLAAAFGMRVVYTSRSAHDAIETATAATRVDLDTLIATSDIVSIHCPLSKETLHLIDRSRLEKMKKGSYLVNTARGPIIDEAALADALERGHLGGARLDVFENEPAVEPRLIAMKNVVLLPHLGSATVETRNEMARIAATNVARYLTGQAPLYAV